DKRKYFSFPFSSVIRMLIGNCAAKALAVGLSSSVEANALLPTLSCIFIVFVFRIGVAEADTEFSVPAATAQPSARAAATARIQDGISFRFIMVRFIRL